MGEVMKNLYKLLSVAVISLCLTIGCAGQKLAGENYSGFLLDYSKLEPDPEGGVAKRYIKPGVDFKQYNKIKLDQVRFYFKPDAADKGIEPDAMKELANIFDKAVIDALGSAYPIVAKPGPDVMRIRVAITNMELSFRAANAIASVTPEGLVNSTINTGGAGKDTGVGEIRMEYEFLDSSTNQLIAGGVDRRSVGQIDSVSKFGTADEAFKFWAQRLRRWLDEVHGK